MRPLRFGLIAALLTVLSALTLAGCGGGLKQDDDDDTPGRRKRGGGGPGPAAKELDPVKGDYKGVIRGEVTWESSQVTPSPLFEAGKTYQDKDYCAAASEYETTDNSIWLSADGKRLGNVFVWIEPKEGTYFDVPKDQLDKVRKQVRIGQPRCAFLPHCEILFPAYYKKGQAEPVRTGQVLVIDNDATVSHNASLSSPNNGSGRGGTLGSGKSLTLDLVADEAPITLGCNIHNWMKGYMRAFNHPYAALTDVGSDYKAKRYQDRASKTFGTYKIEGVPIGATVTIVAWHESDRVGEKGYIEKREITLKADNEINFKARLK